MTEKDHKPAPWQFVDTVSPCGQDWLGCGVVASNGHEFVWLEDDPETDIPTARLIAAAPTMFEYVDAKARSGCEEAISILEKINGS